MQTWKAGPPVSHWCPPPWAKGVGGYTPRGEHQASQEATQEQIEREGKATTKALERVHQAREGQRQAEGLVGELRIKVARLETERAALEWTLDKTDRQLAGLMERVGQAIQQERQAKAKAPTSRARRGKGGSSGEG